MAEAEVVEVELPDGGTVLVRAVPVGGPGDVAFGGIPSFSDVTRAIRDIAAEINGALAIVAPKKATVEFGMQIALKSGKLTALLVEGSGSASLKITLQWGE